MKSFAPLAPITLVLASCMPQPTPAAKADDSALKERMEGQAERLTRLETELHEMRLLFTSQLKRIEEVASQTANLQQQQLPAAPPAQQPHQVVIMPQTPVVTHRWDDQRPLGQTTVPTRAASSSHRVRPGDTLSEIAQRYGVGLANLMAANPGVDPLRLQIDKELVIPGRESVGSTTHFQPGSGTITHTVQAGDTLSEIAERHGVGLDALLSRNPQVDPRRLKIGTKLKIPKVSYKAPPSAPAYSPQAAVSPRPEAAAPANEPAANVLPNLPSAAPATQSTPTQRVFIRVPTSKTLSEIALDWNTDVATINHLNHISLSADHRIPANSTLYVPAK
ncbi:MAG: LysM peptidoglycan-binding domain-containing protein [Verrucomicrobiota bacterium JB023]|nr:LysM peptidoglycan-binding domain-containing protein [Verrucomicrobiota bacterium JB023]